MLWLLASENKDGVISTNGTKLAFRFRMTVAELDAALKPLIKAGFFSEEQDASAVLAPCKRDAITETETETEKELTSDKSDPSKHEPKPVKKKTPYPEAFDAFWREYPTDALMSKTKTFAQWKNLDQPSQEAAQAAVPAFKDYCRKNPTYRPVHAQRFLSERRFDGFEKQTLDPAAVEAARDRADQLLRRGKYAPDYGSATQ